MGGTREILKGCRNEVGASCLFPLSKEIKDYFDFESHGVELIPLPVMAVNLLGPTGRPVIFYKNPLKLAWGVMRTFGLGAMLGFIRFLIFCRYPARVLDRFTARKAPRNLEDLIKEAPTPEKRQQLELAFKGSAIEIIDKFFPDKAKHKRAPQFAGVCCGSSHVQGAVHRRLRAVSDLHHGPRRFRGTDAAR